MKVLLLELSCSDSVSKNPSRYGGAGITMRRLAEGLDYCYLMAEKSCFENDITNKCIPIEKNIVEQIRNGAAASLNYYNFNSFDIYVHCNPSLYIKTDKPQICWGVGQNEAFNISHKHVLLHDKRGQNPIINNQSTKIHEFILGIDVPPFKQNDKKGEYCVQVSNHYPQINSEVLAQWAIRNKIRTLFAGPVSNDCRLLDYIDYDYAIYLGQIKYEEKIKLIMGAKFGVALYSFPINGPPLFAKECLSLGTPFISTPIPSIVKSIKNDVNGYVINSEQEFIEAWSKRDIINQYGCWKTADQWSTERMITSFDTVVKDVLKDG